MSIRRYWTQAQDIVRRTTNLKMSPTWFDVYSVTSKKWEFFSNFCSLFWKPELYWPWFWEFDVPTSKAQTKQQGMNVCRDAYKTIVFFFLIAGFYVLVKKKNSMHCIPKLRSFFSSRRLHLLLFYTVKLVTLTYLINAQPRLLILTILPPLLDWIPPCLFNHFWNFVLPAFLL